MPAAAFLDDALPEETACLLLMGGDSVVRGEGDAAGEDIVLAELAIRLRRMGFIVVSAAEERATQGAAPHPVGGDGWDAVITGFAGVSSLGFDLPQVPVLLATGPEVNDPERAASVEALLNLRIVAEILSPDLSDGRLRARIESCRERARARRREEWHRAEMTRARAQLERERARADELLNAVIPIGSALSVERDLGSLLERILIEAQRFCCADSGSIYLLAEENLLRFAIVRNETLGLAMGGTSGVAITFPPVSLRDAATGEPNHHYIVTHAAVTGKSVNIADAYADPKLHSADAVEEFDFSGTHAFDARTGYLSKSFLTVPLRSATGALIGVLQLINALDWETKEIIPFDANMQQIIEALSLLAAAALEGYIREQRLTEQLNQLRVEIDLAKKARHVAEITETDYFRGLQQKSKFCATDIAPLRKSIRPDA